MREKIHTKPLAAHLGAFNGNICMMNGKNPEANDLRPFNVQKSELSGQLRRIKR